MNLEQLKQAVERHKGRKCFGEFAEDFELFLDTCQLILNSPSLVGDKPSPNTKDYGVRVDYYYALGEASGHNACNEANRIAHARWLSEKLEGLGALIDKTMPCNCHAAYKDRKLSAPDCPNCNFKDDLFEDIRQHFESALKPKEQK